MARQTFAAGLALVALTFVAHGLDLGHSFVWDDDSYLTGNPLVREPGGAWRIVARPLESPQYYPLVFLSFRLEYAIWGLHPAGYHAVNVALQAAGAVLAWRAASKLLPAGAWLAAAVFAVHPVQVETVAWIAERKNLLSGLFYLAALLTYWRFDPPAGSEGRRPLRPYLAAFALSLAALASKTVACSLPAAILLVAWWKRGMIGRRDVAPLLPFFLVGLVAGLGTGWIERHHVGASGPDWAIPPLDRCLIAGRALWFYAGKLAWPHPLCFIYPRWEVDPADWRQDAYPLAALALVATLGAARERIGRGPLVAALFFGGTLLPALGFVDVYPMRFSFVADHFQYLACLGPILPAALGMALAAKALDRRLPGSGTSAVALGLAVLVALTLSRSTSFRDAPTLWRDTLAKNPGCWMAHNHLGTHESALGRFEEAKAHFLAALALRPDYTKAHFNLGSAHEKLGELAPARVHLREAVRLQPDHWEARLLLGLVARRLGDAEEARDQIREAIRLCPGDPAEKKKLARLLPPGPGP